MFDALDLFGASKKVARSIQKFGLKCPSYDILIDSQKHDITRRDLRYTHEPDNNSEIVSNKLDMCIRILDLGRAGFMYLLMLGAKLGTINYHMTLRMQVVICVRICMICYCI